METLTAAKTIVGSLDRFRGDGIILLSGIESGTVDFKKLHYSDIVFSILGEVLGPDFTPRLRNLEKRTVDFRLKNLLAHSVAASQSKSLGKIRWLDSIPSLKCDWGGDSGFVEEVISSLLNENWVVLSRFLSPDLNAQYAENIFMRGFGRESVLTAPVAFVDLPLLIDIFFDDVKMPADYSWAQRAEIEDVRNEFHVMTIRLYNDSVKLCGEVSIPRAFRNSEAWPPLFPLSDLMKLKREVMRCSKIN